MTFADGSEVAADAVVWATGFRLDHSFVELPVFDDRGQVKHERGVTELPGLYFLGLPWQHTRGSALLGWVKDDAQFIAQRIGAARARAPRRTRRHAGALRSARRDDRRDSSDAAPAPACTRAAWPSGSRPASAAFAFTALLADAVGCAATRVPIVWAWFAAASCASATRR